MNTTRQLDWFSVGEDDVPAEDRSSFLEVIHRLKWLTPPAILPFSQGEVIKSLVRQLKLNNVQQVGESSELAPFALLGIRNKFASGVVALYFIDHGDHVTPVLGVHE